LRTIKDEKEVQAEEWWREEENEISVEKGNEERSKAEET
jgi:hypothetical protein